MGISEISCKKENKKYIRENSSQKTSLLGRCTTTHPAFFYKRVPDTGKIWGDVPRPVKDGRPAAADEDGHF